MFNIFHLRSILPIRQRDQTCDVAHPKSRMVSVNVFRTKVNKRLYPLSHHISVRYFGQFVHQYLLFGRVFSTWLVANITPKKSKKIQGFLRFLQKKSKKGSVADGPPPGEDLCADLIFSSILYLTWKCENTANTSVSVPWYVRRSVG